MGLVEELSCRVGTEGSRDAGAQCTGHRCADTAPRLRTKAAQFMRGSQGAKREPILPKNPAWVLQRDRDGTSSVRG